MPKQKHNKLQKKNKVGSADFKKNFDIKKKKGKVGKGKVAGANATSTEINAKALAMPHSSILKASKEERGLVTQRNLSLDELLVQTRHVNAGVRKEALAGLRELVTDHGVILRVRMFDILGRAVELLLDSDQGTRQALQDLLRAAFQQINERIIAPFLELLVVYIKSAIAHSTPSMRFDAMGTLRVAIDAYPRAIAPHLPGLFPLLFQLLSAAEGDKNNKLERRMVMLRTLLVTLQCASGEGHLDEDAVDAGQRVGVRWTAGGTAPVEAFLPRQSSDASDARAAVADACTMSGTDGNPYSLEINAFVPALLPQVWQCWLECCPADLTDRVHHSRDLLLIIRLLLQLFRPASHSPAGLGLPVPPSFVSEIRRHVLTHCPFRPGADGSQGNVAMAGQTGTEGVVSILAAVDVAVCELVAIVAVEDTTSDGGSTATAIQSQPKAPSGATNVVSSQYVWYSPVHDMALELLTDESATNALRGVAAADGIAAFDTGAVLVKVAHTLLRLSHPDDAHDIWSGLTALFRRSRPRETMQRHLFKLWESDPDAVPSSLWKDWLLVLFKLLWDLKATDEVLSHAILCSLLRCLRHRRKQLVIRGDEEEVLQSGEDTIADRMEGLQRAFIPFFCQRTTSRTRRQSAPAKLGAQQYRASAIALSFVLLQSIWRWRHYCDNATLSAGGEMHGDSHGKPQENGQRDVFGPFIQFESMAVQQRAVELLFYFNAVSGPLLHAVIKACQMLPHRPTVAAHLIETLSDRKPSMPLPASCTVIMSMCSPSAKACARPQGGSSAVKLLLDQWHAVVVRGAADRWAARLRCRFAGASLVAVAASTASQIVRNSGAEGYSYRAAGAMGLLATLGGGDGTALLAEVALPGIPVIMSEAHKRRRLLGTPDSNHTLGRSGSAMEVDGNEDMDGSHGKAFAPCQQVVEVLRVYPSLLDQLVLWMEEQCAMTTTTDQEVVDHLQSLRVFRDAHVLRVTDEVATQQVETVARALRIATLAKERGGRVTQAAAELSALLQAASKAIRNGR